MSVRWIPGIIRLHLMQSMPPIFTDFHGVCLSVRPSVSLSVANMSNDSTQWSRLEHVQCMRGSFGAAFAKWLWPLVFVNCWYIVCSLRSSWSEGWRPRRCFDSKCQQSTRLESVLYCDTHHRGRFWKRKRVCCRLRKQTSCYIIRYVWSVNCARKMLYR